MEPPIKTSHGFRDPRSIQDSGRRHVVREHLGRISAEMLDGFFGMEHISVVWPWHMWFQHCFLHGFYNMFETSGFNMFERTEMICYAELLGVKAARMVWQSRTEGYWPKIHRLGNSPMNRFLANQQKWWWQMKGLLGLAHRNCWWSSKNVGLSMKGTGFITRNLSKPMTGCWICLSIKAICLSISAAKESCFAVSKIDQQMRVKPQELVPKKLTLTGSYQPIWPNRCTLDLIIWAQSWRRVTWARPAERILLTCWLPGRLPG